MSASYHTHVAASGLPAMLLAAHGAGLAVLGISEHVFQLRQGRPHFPDMPLEGPLQDLDAYVAEVAYSRAPGMRVCLGLEVDYVPQRMGELRALCAPHPWDFLIGSVHEVDGEAIRARRMGDLRRDWTFWRRYCAAQEQAVRSGLFNILGHPLRLARSVPPPPYLEDLLGPVLDAASVAGVSVELNGDDLGRDAALQGRLIGWAAGAGASLTFGADAHAPEQVAQNAPLAGELLRRHSVAGLTGFRGRRAVSEPLPPAADRGSRVG